MSDKLVGVQISLSAPVLKIEKGRKWLSGRASSCQGEGRESESHLPLHKRVIQRRRSQVVKAGVCKTLIIGSNPIVASSYFAASLKSQPYSARPPFLSPLRFLTMPQMGIKLKFQPAG